MSLNTLYLGGSPSSLRLKELLRMGYFFYRVIEKMDYSILNYVPVSVFLVNSQNEIVFFNNEAREFENMMGLPISIGGDFLTLFPQRTHASINRILAQVRGDQRSGRLEWEHQGTDGRALYFETTCNPLERSGSDLTCVACRDVTSEKVFQKKIVQMAQDFASLVENANAVIFSVDSREYVTEWNKECARISQFTKNEALTKKIGSFVHADSADQFDLFIRSVYAGNAKSNFELHFSTKDANVVNVLVNATPTINNEGKVIGILFVGHDITELSEYKTSLERVVKDRTLKLKLALEKEKELVEIKNRFVSMASHELRIPLSMISSSAKSLRVDAVQAGSLEKIDVIEKQVAHMRALIDDVLTVGKTDPDKIKVSRNWINIVEYIRKLAEEVSVNAQHSHKIVFDTPSTVIEIESDDKLLRSVFLNILSNAIKFSPGQKEIAVSIRSQFEGVEVEVTDYGIGISGEDLATIFQPFTRGSNASEIKGSGLGLSIVKRAIDVLNGTINITSRVGHGTVITVLFNYHT
jgi:PAS domain S-box-containing protein